jgi:hypothetical protein
MGRTEHNAFRKPLLYPSERRGLSSMLIRFCSAIGNSPSTVEDPCYSPMFLASGYPRPHNCRKQAFTLKTPSQGQ